MRPASKAMGIFVSSLIDLLASPEWSRDLAQIGEQNGRVLGKMGHSERTGAHVAKNIPGDKHQPLFQGGVDYFA